MLVYVANASYSKRILLPKNFVDVAMPKSQQERLQRMGILDPLERERQG